MAKAALLAVLAVFCLSGASCGASLQPAKGCLRHLGQRHGYAGVGAQVVRLRGGDGEEVKEAEGKAVEITEYSIGALGLKPAGGWEAACHYASLILHENKAEITADNIAKLLKAADLEIPNFWPRTYERLMKGYDLQTLLTGSSGGGAVAGGSAPAAAAAAAEVAAPEVKGKGKEEKKEEKKKEESEKSESGSGDDMGFGLFD